MRIDDPIHRHMVSPRICPCKAAKEVLRSITCGSRWVYLEFGELPTPPERGPDRPLTNFSLSLVAHPRIRIRSQHTILLWLLFGQTNRLHKRKPDVSICLGNIEGASEQNLLDSCAPRPQCNN